MLNCSDEQSQETDGDHCQAKSMRSDDASAFRGPCPRDAKELLDCEAERDQRGPCPNPRQERALIGETCAINSEIAWSAGFGCSFTAIIHAGRHWLPLGSAIFLLFVVWPRIPMRSWQLCWTAGTTALVAQLSASLDD